MRTLFCEIGDTTREYNNHLDTFAHEIATKVFEKRTVITYSEDGIAKVRNPTYQGYLSFEVENISKCLVVQIVFQNAKCMLTFWGEDVLRNARHCPTFESREAFINLTGIVHYSYGLKRQQ
ncbi:MAG: hypothetical protein UT24_C0011G0013 [Candidatus Woesebacteria bacterium GW2011_GWB1_39_12]|uniref:Uncharacterized protein n=1 Tax=Candidatus Woesebacteria bacterium GW2011_GWB1_39_12 TaxID=1618574 RepID=A0A0G0PQX8_9BACT|nr:MAG: hypothetical protein UT24_C0011G0013 [Candidatus Woesebacteria bacterium GW2011_GWB1_39_12]